MMTSKMKQQPYMKDATNGDTASRVLSEALPRPMGIGGVTSVNRLRDGQIDEKTET